jgi:hypothetical protein
LFTCSSNFQLLFSVFFDYHFNENLKSIESILICLSQIKIIIQKQPFHLSFTLPNILKVNSFKEIQIKNFKTAFQTPIQIGNKKPISLCNLISMIGIIGINFLIDLNIGFNPPQLEQNKNPGKKSSSFKQSLLKNMHNQQNKFLDEIKEEESTFECPICHFQDDKEIIGLPLIINETSLPLFLDDITINRKVKCLSSCNHIFHYSCLKECRNICPLCRKSFSNLLPVLPLYHKLNNEFLQIFQEFSSQISGNLLDSFCSVFILLDFQQRNSQLSTKHNKFYSYIYSILWHQHQFKKFSSSDLPFFSKFIILTLETIQPLQNIREIVISLSHELKIDNLLIFLRRVILFQYFVFEESFDLEQSLITSSLSQQFGLELNEIYLKPFPFIQLPNYILDFARSPFNFPISDQNYRRFVCLIDGTYVKSSSNDPDKIPNITDFIQSKFNIPFDIPFLQLSGDKASAIAFMNSNTLKYSKNFIYVDEFGLSDIGFRRNKYLRISQLKVQNLIHDILTFSIK